MKSGNIRKNLESEIEVSWTKMFREESENNFKMFTSEEMKEAIIFAKKIQAEYNIINLSVELLVLNISEDHENVVFRQEIPFEIY